MANELGVEGYLTDEEYQRRLQAELDKPVPLDPEIIQMSRILSGHFAQAKVSAQPKTCVIEVLETKGFFVETQVVAERIAAWHLGGFPVSMSEDPSDGYPSWQLNFAITSRAVLYSNITGLGERREFIINPTRPAHIAVHEKEPWPPIKFDGIVYKIPGDVDFLRLLVNELNWDVLYGKE